MPLWAQSKQSSSELIEVINGPDSRVKYRCSICGEENAQKFVITRHINFSHPGHRDAAAHAPPSTLYKLGSYAPAPPVVPAASSALAPAQNEPSGSRPSNSSANPIDGLLDAAYIGVERVAVKTVRGFSNEPETYFCTVCRKALGRYFTRARKEEVLDHIYQEHGDTVKKLIEEERAKKKQFEDDAQKKLDEATKKKDRLRESAGARRTCSSKSGPEASSKLKGDLFFQKSGKKPVAAGSSPSIPLPPPDKPSPAKAAQKKSILSSTEKRPVSIDKQVKTPSPSPKSTPTVSPTLPPLVKTSFVYDGTRVPDILPKPRNPVIETPRHSFTPTASSPSPTSPPPLRIITPNPVSPVAVNETVSSAWQSPETCGNTLDMSGRRGLLPTPNKSPSPTFGPISPTWDPVHARHNGSRVVEGPQRRTLLPTPGTTPTASPEPFLLAPSVASMVLSEIVPPRREESQPPRNTVESPRPRPVATVAPLNHISDKVKADFLQSPTGGVMLLDAIAKPVSALLFPTPTNVKAVVNFATAGVDNAAVPEPVDGAANRSKGSSGDMQKVDAQQLDVPSGSRRDTPPVQAGQLTGLGITAACTVSSNSALPKINSPDVPDPKKPTESQFSAGPPVSHHMAPYVASGNAVPADSSQPDVGETAAADSGSADGGEVDMDLESNDSVQMVMDNDDEEVLQLPDSDIVELTREELDILREASQLSGIPLSQLLSHFTQELIDKCEEETALMFEIMSLQRTR